MIVTIGTVLLGILVIVLVVQYRGLRHYLAEARRSKFQYVVAPVYFQSIPWIVFQELLLPLLRKLPSSLTEQWLPLSLFNFIWHAAYEPFEKFGHDTFMVVSPSGNILWTCDPKVTAQIFSRRLDFIKPVDMMQLLNIYGPTITASEGDQHIRYRKIASPSFNETTHQRVWDESVKEAGLMASSWSYNQGSILNLGSDCSRQALHVLSKVFFDKDIAWVDDTHPPPGHELTYNQAASTVFKHYSVLFATPKPILNNSPMGVHKVARKAFVEFGKYMEAMKKETSERLLSQGNSAGDSASLLESFVKAGLPQLTTKETLLSPREVFGNIFIFVLAGHETSANTLTFAITLLALHKDFQKTIQAELDAVFPDKIDDTSSVSYSANFQTLWKGRTGALMKEVLRLYPVLSFLPKTNIKSQSIVLHNKTFTIPAHTTILTNVAALHRNPRYWRTKESSQSLDAFMPDLWLDQHVEDQEDRIGPEAYMPFSEGFRACIGSRFARIEFCATIARILSEWSVELLDESPAGVRTAEELLTSGVKFEMGLKMGQSVNLKLVPRKRYRVGDVVDEGVDIARLLGFFNKVKRLNQGFFVSKNLAVSMSLTAGLLVKFVIQPDS